jgi:hypothetical protein
MAEKYDVLAQKSAPLSSALGTDMPVIPTRKDGSPDYIAGYKAYKEPMLKETKRLLEEQGVFEGLQREEETRQKGVLATGKATNLRKLKSDIEESQTAKDLTTLEDQYMHAAFVPTQATMGEMAAMFSLFGVAGMLIGAGGKGNSQAAMSAMSGMMKGYREGNEDLYKREKSTFDENLKVMGQRKDVLSKRLEQIAKLATMDKDAADQDLDALLAEQGADFYKKYKDKFGLAKLIELDKEVNKTHDKIFDFAVKEDERVREETKRRQEKLEDEQKRRTEKIEDEARRLQNEKTLIKYREGFKSDRKATAADRYGFGDIVAGASNEAAAAIRNLMGLPFESTSGYFGNKQTNSLFTAPLDAFANTLTTESVQRYNTQSGKLGYNLAQLMSGGRAVRVSDVDQMNKILQIREGDTLETAASRIAEARQLAERTIEVRTKSPNTPEGLKEVFRENLQTIKETVPFTVDDINKFVANRDKSITFAQALSKRYPTSESASTPANAGPSAPPSSRAGVETGKDEKGSFHYEYNQDKTKRRKVYD